MKRHGPKNEGLVQVSSSLIRQIELGRLELSNVVALHPLSHPRRKARRPGGREPVTTNEGCNVT